MFSEISTGDELKQITTIALQNASNDLGNNNINEAIRRRVQKGIEQNGQHFEHLIKSSPAQKSRFSQLIGMRRQVRQN
uniref:Uncharacterized protein n=1 Tax=Megaselia scalaris TaxID=36166 RepID=T1H1J8_MEGSC